MNQGKISTAPGAPGAPGMPGALDGERGATGRAAGLAGVVLCGGRSSRMGRPKAWLPFGGEALLQRVVRRLGEAAWPIAVVAAPGQELPPLPEGVLVVRDPEEGRGPLQGIAVGLEAVAPLAERAYVSATDAPFLHPAFVRRLADLQARGHAVAVPWADGHHHPLGAVYACSVRADAAALLAEGTLRLSSLFERTRTLVAEPELLLAEPRLREADLALRSLRNLNTPEDYAAALRELDAAEDLAPGGSAGRP
ncbi:molybdenum cofactor guanylyltransferase [Sorangium sp. So ce119]|uniref:molybdenum cofactor guanylyltransferase n=1 Tax=Sorangium sp. So ce119 TaxID=3133279 RepID=UPI003F621084